MSIYKTLLSDTIIYGFVNAFTKLISFFLFPLLATYFSVIEYGTLDYVQSFTTFLVLSLTFGLDSALVRFFYDNDELQNRKQLITEIFYLELFIIFLYLSLALLLKDQIIELLQIKINSLIGIVILQVPFLLLINFSQNILKWTFQRKQFLTISITYLLTLLGYCLFGVYYLKFDLYYYFLGCLIIQIIYSLIAFSVISKWIFKLDKVIFLMKLLRYALPLGIVSIFTALYPFIERNLVLFYTSEYSLGVYSIIYKYCYIILIIIYSFQIAWGPISYSIYKEKDSQKKFNTVLNIFTLLVCQAILIIYFLSDYIFPWFFGNEFEKMYILIIPLSFAIGIQGVNSMLEASIHLSKKTNWILLINLIYLGCFSTLIIWDEITILKIALTICFSSIIKFIITCIISNRVYEIKWDLRQVTLILLSTFLFGIYAVGIESIIPNIILFPFVLNILIYLFFNFKKIKMLAFNLNHKNFF